MNHTLKIEKICILLTKGPDQVMVRTTMPCPYVIEAMPSQAPLVLQFECSYDTAIDYVKDNFWPYIPVEVINLR